MISWLALSNHRFDALSEYREDYHLRWDMAFRFLRACPLPSAGWVGRQRLASLLDQADSRARAGGRLGWHRALEDGVTLDEFEELIAIAIQCSDAMAMHSIRSILG